VAYATTIHKRNRLTVDSCVVDVGDSMFCNDQAYEALSRVTSRNGLHIVNLNPDSIKAQNNAIVEYNCLRKQFISHPEMEANDQKIDQFPIETFTWKT